MIMLDKKKIIKDSVHNYIEIEKVYFEIIDTPGFQRLKSIKQTSYSSLYPSSTHDRFTHSLGTFFLGKIVIVNILDNFKVEDEIIQPQLESIKFTFIIACLLHDYGHAPFSHTGEDFYKEKQIPNDIPNSEYFKEYKSQNKIQNLSFLDYLLIIELCKVVDCDISKPNNVVKDFLNDYVQTLRTSSAKPHEKMSALLSLRQLNKRIDEITKVMEVKFIPDLFIRCIIGTLYHNQPGINSFKNAIINLLNSDCIDVDKLDYLMRDTYMTGHKTTSIDIDRLISSFTIISDSDKKYRLAFSKKGLSVIESVILASDASKRWVQNHPVIMYDSYLTQRCISEMICLFETDDPLFFEKLFSVEALTEEGIDIAQEHFFLLSDSDLIVLFKKAYNKAKLEGKLNSVEIFEEYFSRNKRKHPLWKSEMEYHVCFNQEKMTTSQAETFEEIIKAIKAIDSNLIKSTGVKQLLFSTETIQNIQELSPSAQKLIKKLNKFYTEQAKKFDIAILLTSGFETKLGKLNRKDFLVEMPNYGLDSWNPDGSLYPYTSLVKIPDNTEKPFLFYFYSKEKIDIQDLITFLFSLSWDEE